MQDFFKELMRRNVTRVALVYIIVAWVTIQVVDVMFPALHVPDWAISITAALIIIGFPFALIFAWAFEITPEGIKREKDVDRSHSLTAQTGRKLDFLFIGALVIAVAFLLFDKLVLSGSEDQVAQVSTKDQAVETPAGVPEKSIAVLPFVNMSGNIENEYFSDGLSEELLNVLARMPGLKVTGRTSSFQFKGENKDLRLIGKQLGVAHAEPLAAADGAIGDADDQEGGKAGCRADGVIPKGGGIDPIGDPKPGGDQRQGEGIGQDLVAPVDDAKRQQRPAEHDAGKDQGARQHPSRPDGDRDGGELDAGIKQADGRAAMAASPAKERPAQHRHEIAYTERVIATGTGRARQHDPGPDRQARDQHADEAAGERRYEEGEPPVRDGHIKALRHAAERSLRLSVLSNS